MGGEGIERISDLIQTIDGGYALAGTTWSYGVGEGDFWLVKLDRSITSSPTHDDPLERFLLFLIIIAVLFVTVLYLQKNR
jgi:hypothetical protein